MLTGAVLGRAGFNRKAAYATAAMALAAEMPDIDTLWALGGPLVGFEHHRGITHTFIALPFEAAALTAVFWGVHRLRKRPANRAPWSWGWLYGGILVGLLSHLLLDWTNNYGIRPSFPFDAHWYAGSFVFIVEPLLYIFLVGALLLPWLFGLINGEIGAKKKGFAGRGWAWCGLTLVLSLYGFRSFERNRALQITASQLVPLGAADGGVVLFASPHPGNPFHWSVVEYGGTYYRFYDVDTWNEGRSTAAQPGTLYLPETTLALLAAKRTELGKIYLDWSMFPVLTEEQDDSDPNHPLKKVTFADARFFYDSNLLTGQARPPLSGSVLLDMQAREGKRVVETQFDGHEQK